MLEPFSIFANLPTLAAAAVFPRMQRIASLANFGGAALSLPIPYRLRGLMFDSSLFTPNTLLGVCVVIGQDMEFIGYSQGLQVIANHAAFPNGGTSVSLSCPIDLPAGGLLIPPNKSIALYGYGSGAGEHLFAAAALQMERVEGGL